MARVKGQYVESAAGLRTMLWLESLVSLVQGQKVWMGYRLICGLDQGLSLRLELGSIL